MSFASGVSAGLSILASRRAYKQQQLANHIRGYDLDPRTGNYVPNAYGRQVESTNMSLATARQNAAIAKSKQAQVDATGADVQLAMMQQQLQRLQDTINTSGLTTAVTQLTQGKHKDAQVTINNIPSLKEKLATEMGVTEVAPIDWANDGAIIQSAMKEAGLTLTPEQLRDPEVYDSMNKSFVKVRDANGNWKVVSTAGIAHETGVLNYVDDETRTGIANTYNSIMDIWQKKHILTPREQAIKDKDLSILEGYQDKGITTTGAAEIEKQAAKASAEAQYPTPKTEEERRKAELAKAAASTTTAKLYADVSAKIKANEPITPEEEQLMKARTRGKPLNAAEVDKLTGFVATEVSLRKLAAEVKADPSLWKPLNTVMNTAQKLVLAMKQAVNGDKDAEAKAERLREQLLKTKGIKENSKIQTIVAMFVNSISGQAVTDNEFSRHLTNLTGGTTISSAEGLIAALSGSAEGLGAISEPKLRVYFDRDPSTVYQIMKIRGTTATPSNKQVHNTNVPYSSKANTKTAPNKSIDLSQFDGAL